jgi:hypothetical protein
MRPCTRNATKRNERKRNTSFRLPTHPRHAQNITYTSHTPTTMPSALDRLDAIQNTLNPRFPSIHTFPGGQLVGRASCQRGLGGKRKERGKKKRKERRGERRERVSLRVSDLPRRRGRQRGRQRGLRRGFGGPRRAVWPAVDLQRWSDGGVSRVWAGMRQSDVKRNVQPVRGAIANLSSSHLPGYIHQLLLGRVRERARRGRGGVVGSGVW